MFFQKNWEIITKNLKFFSLFAEKLAYYKRKIKGGFVP